MTTESHAAWAREIGETIRFVAGCVLTGLLLYGIYCLMTFQGKLNQ